MSIWKNFSKPGHLPVIPSPAILLGLGLMSATSAYSADFHSPRTTGIGGSGHAAPLLNDATYLNPSFVSLLKSYSLSYSFLKYNGSESQPDTNPQGFYGRSFNFSVQDGRTKMFQAGVGYTVKENRSILNVAISRSVHQRVGLGVGGKFLFPAGTGASNAIQDAIVSGTFVASQAIQTVLIVDNLIETDRGKTQGLYREVILGSKIIVLGQLVLYFDPHYAPSLEGPFRLGHEAGLELSLMSDLFIRVGQFRNSNVPYQSERGNGWALGLGWVGPRIGIDYGYKRVTGWNVATLPSSYSHILGTTVFF